MQKKRPKKNRCPFFFLVAMLAILATPTDGIAQQSWPRLRKWTVVLDPGHGGNERGAESAGGILEKNVTLNLARMIAREIHADYQVVLTRTDDYRLEIPNRTATANHLKADLFVSLHAGGSFLHNVSGMSIFYFEDYPSPSLVEQKPVFGTVTNGEPQPLPWNGIQDTYVTRSKKLAQRIQAQLIQITQDPEIRIKGAPLAVLQGADMPAVVIECGYLTNPNEAKALEDVEFLALIAGAIGKAIEAYVAEMNQ